MMAGTCSWASANTSVNCIAMQSLSYRASVLSRPILPSRCKRSRKVTWLTITFSRQALHTDRFPRSRMNGAYERLFRIACTSALLQGIITERASCGKSELAAPQWGRL